MSEPARWLEAQEAEREFWSGVPANPAVVAAIVRSLCDVAAWARPRIPADARHPWVEIGIGPLGLGVAHFLRADPDRPSIVGIDPIELEPRALETLPDPLARLVEACRRGYEHVQAQGERTGLASARFGAAFLNNMLDHVDSPLAVLAETRRLLVPGGHLILTCDVFSALGRLKHERWARRRHPDSIVVRAHPHRLSAGDLPVLLARAGFALEAISADHGRWQRAAGRARDVTVHATAR